jgi:hypothetical protein
MPAPANWPRNYETTLPGVKANQQGKKTNYRTGTDDQHGQRRSIKEARSRLDCCLDGMSAFRVHKDTQRVRVTLSHNR